jgi:hypothetical protein
MNKSSEYPANVKQSIIPTFWTLNDCNDAGRALNPSAEALFLDSMLTARAFENTCGMYAMLVSFLLRVSRHKIVLMQRIFVTSSPTYLHPSLD